MNYKTLFIIGNGFDLCHGIKTSYTDFKHYLEEYFPDVKCSLETFNEHGQQLWSDVERHLIDLDEELLSQYYEDSLVSYASDDWSDRYHHEYQELIEHEIWNMSYGLKNALVSWLGTISIESYSTKESIIKLFAENKDSFFLNFNYTDTIEKLYNIDESKILYLHNKYMKNNYELVFGHSVIEDNVSKGRRISNYEPEDYDFTLQSDDVRVLESITHIKEYYVTNCKPTKKIIEENKKFFNSIKSINDIYVLGHSVSDVDILYFCEINKINNNAKWHISWYDTVDRENKFNSLDSIGIHEDDVEFFQL